MDLEGMDNIWILGDIFMSKYLSIFDSDNMTIGKFYSIL